MKLLFNTKKKKILSTNLRLGDVIEVCVSISTCDLVEWPLHIFSFVLESSFFNIGIFSITFNSCFRSGKSMIKYYFIYIDLFLFLHCLLFLQMFHSIEAC